MEENTFYDGQYVLYHLGDHYQLPGFIRGRAFSGVPSLGAAWMVEDSSGKFPTGEYPYKTVIVFEAWITP